MIAAKDLRGLIRDIPDFPKPGILFKDITPLMADAGALDAAVRGLRVQCHQPAFQRSSSEVRSRDSSAPASCSRSCSSS